MSQKNTIEEWITTKGAQAPIIVTGYNPQKIKTLIKETIDSNVQNKVVNKTDITETEATKSTISIKQIRELLPGISLTPVKLRRIAIIYDAHKLSMPAANALLKSLEEAPAYMRFILATSWASRLPVTILSRCTRIRVDSELNQEQTTNLLSNIRQSIKANNIDSEDITAIEEAISNTLRKQGPSLELKMAAMRLIDYYRIKGSGGNEKLARDVLLMYLPNN